MRAQKRFQWWQSNAWRTLWAAIAVFVPLVLLAAGAVHIVPRSRGIAFMPELRYWVTTLACAVSAIAATVVYALVTARSRRPSLAFGGGLIVSACAVLALLGLTGSPGLMMAAAPAVLLSAITLAVLVPWSLARPPRGVRALVIVLLGVLELAGVVAAIASERVAPAGSDGRAFEIPRTLFGAESRFVDLPSAAGVHYVDEGSGEILLFLHGNPAWSFQWRELVQGLRGSYRCIALDYPGFGLSPAPVGFGFTPGEQSRVVEEFVDRLGLSEVTLVMQDWGGPIGLGLAGRRPELVRRVILGNTWAWPTRRTEARGLFSVIAGGPLGEFLQMNFNGIVRFALDSGTVRKLPDDVRELYLRPFRPLARRGVAAFYPGQITAASAYMSEVEAGLTRLGDRPALIFWGLQDPGFPRADLQRFERGFPNHRTIELADADHFFFEDAADRVIPEIQAFLGRTVVQSASH